MKPIHSLRSLCYAGARTAFILLSLLAAANTVAAPSIRLAIGPFFSPAGNRELESLSATLPDLLTAEMSGTERFQMVEREQAGKVFSELDLDASGVVRQSDVAALGHLLSCDWLVTGSLVPTSSGTVVWTKIVDVRNGVVLDMSAKALGNSDPMAVARSIAEFVGEAKPGGKGRDFVALGPIIDFTPSHKANAVDWPGRIAAGIERHFHQAGYGVAELAAVMPIFQERSLETLGLTGVPEPRVKLQNAFWFLDGACERKLGSPDELRLQFRIQRIGAKEQMLTFTAPASTNLEAVVIKELMGILRQAPGTSVINGELAETEFLKRRTDEQIRAIHPFQPESTKVLNIGLEGFIRHREELERGRVLRESTFANYRRLLLQDPGNSKARHMLGMGLVADADPDKRQEGKELLYEVHGRDNPSINQEIARAGENGLREETERNLVPSLDLPALEMAYTRDPSDIEATYNLGALLVHSNDGPTQDRGADLLRAVMASDNTRLVEQARRICPAPGTRTHRVY